MDVKAIIFTAMATLDKRWYYYQRDAVADFRAIVKATPHPIAMLITEGPQRRLYATGPRGGTQLIREWYAVEDDQVLSTLWMYPILPLLMPTTTKEPAHAHV